MVIEKRLLSRFLFSSHNIISLQYLANTIYQFTEKVYATVIVLLSKTLDCSL